MSFEKNAALLNHQLKQERLVFEVAITANATPASKQHHVDIPGVVLLRTEGKTADADAVEDLSATFTTADDENSGNCVFGVLVTELGDIEKVSKITVTEKTALSSSLAVTAHGTSGLTTDGNIAFSVAGTGLRLDTESPTLVVEIEYTKQA